MTVGSCEYSIVALSPFFSSDINVRPFVTRHSAKGEFLLSRDLTTCWNHRRKRVTIQYTLNLFLVSAWKEVQHFGPHMQQAYQGLGYGSPVVPTGSIAYSHRDRPTDSSFSTKRYYRYALDVSEDENEIQADYADGTC